MNFVKPTSIVFVLAIGAAAVAMSASAQQPTPLPHVPIGLPSQAPGRWSQNDWDAARGRCQALADKDAAHIRFSPLDNSAAEACMSLSWGLNQQPEPPLESPQPQFHNSPLATPTPDGSSSNSNVLAPLLSEASVVGPPPSPAPFTGGTWDTCTSSPPATTANQPPDVAGDVSGSQAVEQLNDAIWIFDKSGNPLGASQGYPKSLTGLTGFWSANSPGSNTLSDTQIAFEPNAQRWLASVESFPDHSHGDLYFAFSKTSDATQGWNYYKVPNVCSTPQPSYPFPDMPILGFNQDWVAIELQCFNAADASGPQDQLILIPHGILTQSPAPASLGQTQKARRSWAPDRQGTFLGVLGRTFIW